MIIDLSGKTAIVTGSTGGIGLAIATGLARAGATVTIVGREQSRVDTAVAKLREASGRDDAKGVVSDVGTLQGCQALIAAQPQADILISNLGIYGAREFFDIDDALWEEFFQVNIMSGVRLASTLLHRFANPEEVANLCVYAASEQASATTGTALRVEGGIVESIA